MRQQVNFTVEMTFDADATLDAEALQHAVNELLYPLWAQGQTARTAALVLVRTAVSKPIEEAAIYGNDEAAPTIQPHTVEALRKAMADAPAHPRTGAAFVNIDTRILALLLPS